MDKYYTFDRINNEKVLSFYSRKPIDFGGPAAEGEGRRKLIEMIEADFGYRFRAVKQSTKQIHSDRVVTVDEQNLEQETGGADGLTFTVGLGFAMGFLPAGFTLSADAGAGCATERAAMIFGRTMKNPT